jgi:dTMP kinase
MSGLLIAFEGLDQSGKETQARLLVDALGAEGRACHTVSFPDYGTPIGRELAHALAGEREYGPDVMQLLYVANRHERRPDLVRWLEGDEVVVCDRYVASSIAYGAAQGLEAAWLSEIQSRLPPADLTILLDIPPGTAMARKAAGRDRYERDLALLARVRAVYLDLASGPGWMRLDGDRPSDVVSREVTAAVRARLSRR